MKKINRKTLANRGGGSGKPKSSGGSSRSTLVPFSSSKRGTSKSAQVHKKSKYQKSKTSPTKSRADYYKGSRQHGPYKKGEAGKKGKPTPKPKKK